MQLKKQNQQRLRDAMKLSISTYISACISSPRSTNQSADRIKVFKFLIPSPIIILKNNFNSIVIIQKWTSRNQFFFFFLFPVRWCEFVCECYINIFLYIIQSEKKIDPFDSLTIQAENFFFFSSIFFLFFFFPTD